MPKRSHIYCAQHKQSNRSRTPKAIYLPLLRPCVAAVGVALGIGFLINDSGIVIPATGMAFAVPVLIAAAAQRRLGELGVGAGSGGEIGSGSGPGPVARTTRQGRQGRARAGGFRV